MSKLQILKIKNIVTSLLLFFLVGCPSEYNKVAIIHLVDISKSAVDDESFSQSSLRTCAKITDLLFKGDSYIKIPVDSRLPPFEEPTRITTREQIDLQRKNCKNNEPNSNREGTFACPAWERAIIILNRIDLSEYTPFIVSQIQSNELEFQIEPECVDLVTELARLIKENGGFFVHANSTNKESELNDWLTEHLVKSFPDTVYLYSNSVSSEVEQKLLFIKSFESKNQQADGT